MEIREIQGTYLSAARISFWFATIVFKAGGFFGMGSLVFLDRFLGQKSPEGLPEAPSMNILLPLGLFCTRIRT